eukprot:7271739-Pyramimonas_sp.AAC.2
MPCPGILYPVRVCGSTLTLSGAPRGPSNGPSSRSPRHNIWSFVHSAIRFFRRACPGGAGKMLHYGKDSSLWTLRAFLRDGSVACGADAYIKTIQA